MLDTLVKPLPLVEQPPFFLNLHTNELKHSLTVTNYYQYIYTDMNTKTLTKVYVFLFIDKYPYIQTFMYQSINKMFCFLFLKFFFLLVFKQILTDVQDGTQKLVTLLHSYMFPLYSPKGKKQKIQLNYNNNSDTKIHK